MQFSIPTVISLLAVGSQAIPTIQSGVTLQIPAGQRNGAYIVHNWGTPQELHERVPDVPEHERQAYAAARYAPDADETGVSDAQASHAAHLFRRDPYIACGCIDLNHQDCDDATHWVEFFAHRDLTVRSDMCFYKFVQSVVAFACVNKDQMSHLFTPSDLRSVWKTISNNCGLYKAGTNGWQGAFAVGYMTSDHEKYLDDAWKSSRTSC